MIRTVAMLTFWAVALPIVAVICMPYAFLTGNIMPLYRLGMWGAIRCSSGGSARKDDWS